MPSDPENKMDELLKAYARKRLDEAGAPFELHPATRKLLQDEVARQRPRPTEHRESWFSRMFVFWPQLAMTASILVAVGIAAWMLSPPAREDTVLAKRADAPQAFESRFISPPTSPAPVTPAKAPSPDVQHFPAPAGPAGGKNAADKENAPSQQPSIAFAEQLGQTRSFSAPNEPIAKQETLKPASPAAEAIAPVLNYSLNLSAPTNAVSLRGYLASNLFTPGNTPPTLPSLTLADAADAKTQPTLELATAVLKDFPEKKESFSTLAKNKTLDDGARLTAAKASDAYSRQRSVADGATSNAGSLRLRFIQTALVPATRKPGTGPATPPAVLSQFEVKQDGARLQLVDFDGSVYEGWVDSGDPVVASFATEARVQTAPKDETPPARAETDALKAGVAGLRNMAFHVSGISRQLGQPIVVEGNLFLSTDQPAVSDAPAPTAVPLRGPGRGAVPARGVRPMAVPAGGRPPGTATNGTSVQRVIGKVRIGATTEVRLDAVPAKN